MDLPFYNYTLVNDTCMRRKEFTNSATSLVWLELRQRFDGYRSFNSVADVELVTPFIDFAESTLSQSPEIEKWICVHQVQLYLFAPVSLE